MASTEPQLSYQKRFTYLGLMPLDHSTPNWVRPDASFFVTLCAKKRGLNVFCHPHIGPAILESVEWRNQQQKWYCSLALLMPDHLHLIVQSPANTTLERSIREWKSWLVRKHQIVWQSDFFDHRLRNEKNELEKSDYILYNPVRAGLVDQAQDWPYTFIARG